MYKAECAREEKRERSFVNSILPLDSVVWYGVYSFLKEEQRWVPSQLDKLHAELGLA